MGRRAIDETGNTYGQLTVLRKTKHRKRNHVVWECQCSCGNIAYVIGIDLRRRNTRSCGCLQREVASEKMSARTGSNHPRWKGGRKKDSYGYILIRQPDHPYVNKNGYVPEHRLVCERIHKRYLRPEETVHHINGIRDDNRPENLWIFESNADHLAFHRWT